jgi:hypothetical protein
MANTWVSVLSEINPDPNPSGGAQTNATAWGVPGDKVMALEIQANKCAMLLAKVKDPTTATRVLRKQCNAAFVLLVTKMRSLHTHFYDDTFPEVELYRLGLRPHGADLEEETENAKQIEFGLRTLPSNHEVIAPFKRLGVLSRGKGKHHAAEVRIWKRRAGEPAPASVKEAGWESYAVTASPWRKAFDGTEAGMCLYVAMRWEDGSVGADGNEDAGKNPWSAIQCIIIP